MSNANEVVTDPRLEKRTRRLGVPCERWPFSGARSPCRADRQVSGRAAGQQAGPDWAPAINGQTSFGPVAR